MKAAVSARALALVPIVSALLVGAIVFPRSTEPADVPLPLVNQAAIDKIEQEERALLDGHRQTPLAPELRILGTELRKFFRVQVVDRQETVLAQARVDVDRAGREAFLLHGHQGLRALRAAQTESFLAAVRDFEATGQVTDELTSAGGAFVTRMGDVGWVRNGHVLMDPETLRVAYRAMWNGALGVTKEPGLALGLDEERVLYKFYLQNPHATEGMFPLLAQLRKKATDEASCRVFTDRERESRELWRVDKIRRIGAIDPTYPEKYALGVAFYRAGDYAQSAQAFRDWLQTHPSGPYTQRAQNHLRAVMRAEGQ
jgi:hypothetical protein